MGWLGIIIFAILVITSVAAWINTKIILEDIDKIKKHIGIPEDKPIDFQVSIENYNDEHDKKQE